MEEIKVGDILVAESYCGFPDSTTKGKEYVVSKVEVLTDGRIMFWIIGDDGKEHFPVSTKFKK